MTTAKRRRGKIHMEHCAEPWAVCGAITDRMTADEGEVTCPECLRVLRLRLASPCPRNLWHRPLSLRGGRE